MRESIRNAVKSNMSSIVLGFPFVLYLFVSLFMGNYQLRRQLMEQQAYYERRLFEADVRNSDRHGISAADREKIHAEIKSVSAKVDANRRSIDDLARLVPGAQTGKR